MNIVWKGSPNFTKGRSGQIIKKLVIHWFGTGTLESANSRFQNPTSQVSAHYGVSKGRIWQWVKEEDTAFHAGNYAVNQETIGIENDATLNHNLSEDDYSLTASLVADICKRHGIPLDTEHIIPHKAVKPTKCPGTIDIPKIINLAKGMTLNIQLVFNNQKYTKETEILAQTKARMEYLSGGKVSINWLTPIYTNHTNIPALVYMDAFSGENDCAVSHDWFLRNVYNLNKEADVVVFVGKKGDWQYQANGVTTYGHYYSTLPTTFPALIQIVAEEDDISWKWGNLSAFTHYVTHEISHALYQASGAVDKTHQLDYMAVDGLIQGLPNLEYNKVNYVVAHQVGYLRKYMVYKKQGDGTLYFAVGDVLIPFASTYEDFLADLKDAIVVELSANEFLRLRQAKKLVVKAR